MSHAKDGQTLCCNLVLKPCSKPLSFVLRLKWKALPDAKPLRIGDQVEHLQEVEQHKKLVSQGWRPAVGSTVYVPRLNASLKVCDVCSCK